MGKIHKIALIKVIIMVSFLLLVSSVLAQEYEYYITNPPYENQNTDPEDGTEKSMYSWWDPEDPSYYRIFADADKDSGIIKLEAYEIGNDFPTVFAWGEFNTNPPPGNSPQVVGGAGQFRCAADFYSYGCLIGPEPDALSAVFLIIYVYQRYPFEEWTLMDVYQCEFNSWEWGGEHSLWVLLKTPWYELVPYVGYSMATCVKVGAHTTVSAKTGICAWADFRSDDYLTWTVDMTIVVERW